MKRSGLLNINYKTCSLDSESFPSNDPSAVNSVKSAYSLKNASQVGSVKGRSIHVDKLSVNTNG